MKKIWERIQSRFFCSESGEKPRFDFKKFFVRFCCLLAAVLLWLGVVGQSEENDRELTYYAVPVSINGATEIVENEGLSIISGYDYDVNITVRGSRAKLSAFSSEDIVASVDVSGIHTAGDYSLPLSVTCPPSSGFTVVRQSLETVMVSVDRITTKELPLSVNILSAKFDTETHILGAPTVSPETVTLTGPQKVLDTVKNAEVNLELGTITATIGYSSRVILLDVNGNEATSPFIRLSTTYAEGTVPYISVEEASKIIVKSVPLTCGFRYGYYRWADTSVNVTPAYVDISGYESVVSKITSIDLEKIDETRYTHSTVLELPITVPSGVTLVSPERTARVILRLEETASVSREVNVREFNNENASAGLMGDTVLLFHGNPDDLKKFSEDKEGYTVSVDTTGITESGIYLLPLKVKVASEHAGVFCEYTEALFSVDLYSAEG